MKSAKRPDCAGKKTMDNNVSRDTCSLDVARYHNDILDAIRASSTAMPFLSTKYGDGEIFGPQQWCDIQLKAASKKFITSKEVGDELSVAALSEFVRLLPDRIKDNAKLSELDLNVLPRDERLVIQIAKTVIASILGDFDQDEWFNVCKHGPGAAVLVPFVKNTLSEKMNSPSSSARVESLWNIYLKWDPHARSALESSISSRCDPVDTGEDKPPSAVQIVPGDELTTVRKDDLTDRVICKQPVVNTFLQQGLMILMFQALALYIPLWDAQERHQMMARLGSMFRRLATIDKLKSSDCVYIELVRLLFPPKWFAVLDYVRCDTTSYTLPNGNIVKLELPMIGTMGNSCTFPIQTIIFYALAVACVTVRDPRYKGVYGKKGPFYHSQPSRGGMKLDSVYDDVSVFGDDVIIPASCADLYIRVCSVLCIRINDAKTHYESDDPFRESCGGDYFSGLATRPIFYKNPINPESVNSWQATLYLMINETYTRLISNFGDVVGYKMFEPFETLFYRYCFFLKFKVKVVPDNFPSDAGIYARVAKSLTPPRSLQFSRIYSRSKDLGGGAQFYFLEYEYRKGDQEINDDCTYWMKLKSPSKYVSLDLLRDVYPLTNLRYVRSYNEESLTDDFTDGREGVEESIARTHTPDEFDRSLDHKRYPVVRKNLLKNLAVAYRAIESPDSVTRTSFDNVIDLLLAIEFMDSKRREKDRAGGRYVVKHTSVHDVSRDKLIIQS